MKNLVAAVAVFMSFPCFAAPEVFSTAKQGDPGTFAVNVEFAPNGRIFIPIYSLALDHAAMRSAELCPDGYIKLSETVGKLRDNSLLTWDIRCITPATLSSNASPAPK
ncbi:MAG: hypothetical protein Q7U97_06725 [Rhodocyclaceae bacterium]|nr:hypothetical protein [Rhodocyclaceae bacterium]